MEGAAGECTIEDFPLMGESATFEWNESTQHLELAEIMGAPEDPEDMEPDLARFDGSWTAQAWTPRALYCLITEFACEISNGDLSCRLLGRGHRHRRLLRVCGRSHTPQSGGGIQWDHPGRDRGHIELSELLRHVDADQAVGCLRSTYAISGCDWVFTGGIL